MKTSGGSKERKRERAEVAKEIVARLTTPAVKLSGKELAFVMSVGEKVKRTGWVSGKQVAWLRGLQLRHWGVNELAEATGRE